MYGVILIHRSVQTVELGGGHVQYPLRQENLTPTAVSTLGGGDDPAPFVVHEENRRDGSNESKGHLIRFMHSRPNL